MANQNPVPAPGFEGCEKKLIIYFATSANMRTISRPCWDDILTDARCTIINNTSNEHFDSYVLSESSLFVFPNKIMIKTCGTTRLLNCLPRLLKAAEEIGTEPTFVQFSRSNFIFPTNQPYPHRSFSLEVQYLNTFFPEGHAFILGPLNGPRWHVYTADLQANGHAGSEDQTLEIAMFDLDRDVMRQFYRAPTTPQAANLGEEKNHEEKKLQDEFVYPTSGVEATIMAGIDKLMPGAVIDDFLFTPCGYSCNALKDDVYFTIHITPEPQCSFVSFETNLKVASYGDLMQLVLNTFKPGNFIASVFVGESSLAASTTNSTPVLPWNLENYTTKGRTKHHFEHHYDVSCTQGTCNKSKTNSNSSTPTKELSPRSSVSPKNLSPRIAYSIDLCNQESLDMSAVYLMGQQLEEYQLRSLAVAAVKKTNTSVDIIPSSTSVEYLRQLIAKESPEDAFSVVSLDEMVSRFYRWANVFPRVQPFYHATCSYPQDVGFLSALNAMGCAFTVSSPNDMNKLFSIGVSSSRIMVSNLCKSTAQIQLARRQFVTLLSFDSITELRKIINHHPDAALVLQLAVEPRNIMNNNRLGSVAPCKTIGITMDQIPIVLNEIKKLDATLVGVSIDMNYRQYKNENDESFVARVESALTKVNNVFTRAHEILGYSLSVVDLGDGFDSEVDDSDHYVTSSVEKFSPILNNVLDKLFAPDVRIFARPSRFLAATSQTLAVSVIDRQYVNNNGSASVPVSPCNDESDTSSLSSSLDDNHNRDNLCDSPMQRVASFSDVRSLLLEAEESNVNLNNSKFNQKTISQCHYFVNDSIYGSLAGILTDHIKIKPVPISVSQNKKSLQYHPCSIFGLGSDDVDCVVDNEMLPHLDVGDWLCFRNVGALSRTNSAGIGQHNSVRYFSSS